MDQNTLMTFLKPEDPSTITDIDDMFDGYNIPGVTKLFKEADEDNSGGLDIEEFCSALQTIYKSIKTDDLTKLHMKIDTNCDGTVDLMELLDFLNHKIEVSEQLDPKCQLFPNPAKVIPVGRKNVVRILFRCLDDKIKSKVSDYSSGQIRPYVKCQYLAVSADGLLQCWTLDMEDSFVVSLFKTEQQNLPFSHTPSMHVSDMAYIPELNQVAVSTSKRELLFFHCGDTAEHFNVAYALVEEEHTVTSMNYWSDDNMGIFAYGTENGYLTLFISHNVKENGLFCSKAFEKTSLQSYKICFVSTLLRRRSQSFVALRIPVFTDDCSDICYFPELRSFAVCGRSSSMMTLVCLTRSYHGGFSQKVSKRCFKSPNTQQFFTCVDYSPWSKVLMTGGADGCLRVWSPFESKSSSGIHQLTGHTRPVTHLRYNLGEKIFLSVSEDKNIRMWSDGTWLCLKSFYIYGMKDTPVSSMCYNTLNNELYLANTHLGHFFGSGTDVCQSLLRSHHMPLCTVLHHELFKQVISICQAGVVSVWDVFTGKVVIQFRVAPENCVGPTAMSFDPSRRKLIVVTADGKLSFWNFNNGKELGVHPVTLPKQVSGVVCSVNRVFVSMKDSKVIYDLDVQGQQNRFLQHHLLKDIACMDLHESRLITSSSDENLVIWDADTAMVMYIISNTCPRVLLASKTDQGKITDLPSKKISQSKKSQKTDKKAKALILSLKTRPFNKDTATLLVSANGYISAWSAIIRGKLIAKFRAVKNDEAYITCMSTNTDESILLTGHSNGIVCLWDIENFGFKANADDGQQVSLHPPQLLISWQAHPTDVVSVLYVSADDKIITAGLDCYIKHWTNKGHCVGIYGKDKWDATTTTSSPEPDMKPYTGKTEVVSPMTAFELSLPPTPPTLTSPIADAEELQEKQQLIFMRLSGQYSPQDLKMWKRLTEMLKEAKENKTERANIKEEIDAHLKCLQQSRQTAQEYIRRSQKTMQTLGILSELKSSPPAHTESQKPKSQRVVQQSVSQTVKRNQNQHTDSSDLSSVNSKDVQQKETIFTERPPETRPALRRPKLTPQHLQSPLPPDDYRSQRTADAPQMESRDLRSQRPLYLPLIQTKDGLKPHPPAADTKDLRNRNPQISVDDFKTEPKNTNIQRFSEKFTVDVPGKNLPMKPLPPQKQPEVRPALRRPKLTPQRLQSPLPPDDYRSQRTADAPQMESRDLRSQRPLYLPLIQTKDGLKPHPPAADTKDLRNRNPQISVDDFKTEPKNTNIQRFSEKFTVEVPGKNLPMKPLPPQKQPEVRPALRRPKLTPQRLQSPLPPDDYRSQRTADAPQMESRDLRSQRPLYLPLIQTKDGLKPHPPAADTKDLRNRNPQISVDDFKTEPKNTNIQRFSEKFTVEVPGKNLPMTPLPPQKQPEVRPALRRPKLTPQRLQSPLPPDDYRSQRTADAPQMESRDLRSQRPLYLPLIQTKDGLKPHPPAADTKDLRNRNPQISVDDFKTEPKNTNIQRFSEKFTVEVPGKNLPMTPLPPQKQPEVRPALRRPKLTPQRLQSPLPPDDYRSQRTADAPQMESRDLRSQRPLYLPLIQTKDGLKPHPPAADTKDLRNRNPQISVDDFKTEPKNTNIQRFSEKFTVEVPGKNLPMKPLPPQKQPEVRPALRRPKLTPQRLQSPLPPDDYRSQRTADAPQMESRDLRSQRPLYLPLIQTKDGLKPHPPAADTKDLRNRNPQISVDDFKTEPKNTNIQRFSEKFTVEVPGKNLPMKPLPPQKQPETEKNTWQAARRSRLKPKLK